MLSSANMTLDIHPKTEDTDNKSSPFLDSSHASTMPPVNLPPNSFSSPYPPSYLNSYPQMDGSYPPAQPGYPFSMNNSGSYPYASAYSPPRMGYPPDPYGSNVTSLMGSKAMSDR